MGLREIAEILISNKAEIKEMIDLDKFDERKHWFKDFPAQYEKARRTYIIFELVYYFASEFGLNMVELYDVITWELVEELWDEKN